MFRPVIQQVHEREGVSLCVAKSRRGGASGTAHVRTGLRPLGQRKGLVLGRTRGSGPRVGQVTRRFGLFGLRLACPTSKPSYIRKKGEVVSHGTERSRGPIVIAEGDAQSRGGCEIWASVPVVVDGFVRLSSCSTDVRHRVLSTLAERSSTIIRVYRSHTITRVHYCLSEHCSYSGVFATANSGHGRLILVVTVSVTICRVFYVRGPEGLSPLQGRHRRETIR